MSKLYTVFLVVLLSACTDQYPSELEIEQMMHKHGCVPTNEFVGKDAERLYECNNGIKYKYTSFYYWAYLEKKNAK